MGEATRGLLEQQRVRKSYSWITLGREVGLFNLTFEILPTDTELQAAWRDQKGMQPDKLICSISRTVDKGFGMEPTERSTCSAITVGSLWAAYEDNVRSLIEP